MSVIVVEPARPILSEADLRRFVPCLEGLDDTHLRLLIAVAQQAIEPPNSWVGRAFGVQTLEVVTDDFCAIDSQGVIPLPHPPIASIVSITYEDRSGVVQTVPPANYRSSLEGILCGVRPAPGLSWPATSRSPDAVRIRFVAGYADDSPELLPAKQAVALSVQSLRSLAREDIFLKRESANGIVEKEWTVSPQAERLMQSAIERLLLPYRIYL